MSKTNGGAELPMTGDARTDAALMRLRERLDKHDVLLESITDALVVNAHLEKRQSEMLLHHTEFIAGHEDFIKQHETKMREIDEKLNAFIDIVMRREGGPEARL